MVRGSRGSAREVAISHNMPITPPFDIKVLGSDGRHRVVLAGELDLSKSPILLATVQDLISTRPDELEVDLREVRFIDSTGLRTLLVANDEAEHAGIAFYVIPSNSPQVRTVFEVTLLLDTLAWREPIEDAQRKTIEQLEQAYEADDRSGSEPDLAG